MRTQLQSMDGERLRFRAVFVRLGWADMKRTLLLSDVCLLESGEQVTDHLWFAYTVRWQALGDLVAGDVIEFDARVKAYKAGYRGWRLDAQMVNPSRIDYKLAWPTALVKV